MCFGDVELKQVIEVVTILLKQLKTQALEAAKIMSQVLCLLSVMCCVKTSICDQIQRLIFLQQLSEPRKSKPSGSPSDPAHVLLLRVAAKEENAVAAYHCLLDSQPYLRPLFGVAT